MLAASVDLPVTSKGTRKTRPIVARRRRRRERRKKRRLVVPKLS